MAHPTFEVPVIIYSITAQYGTVTVRARNAQQASSLVQRQIDTGRTTIDYGKVFSDETTEITLDDEQGPQAIP